MKNRQGSYKKILLDTALLGQKKEYLLKNIRVLTQMPLSPFELCTLYILLFLRIRHPQNWAQKKRELKDLSPRPLLDIIPSTFELTEWEKRKLAGVSAENLFATFNLKGIPEAINRTMVNWSQKHWNIELLFHIPSPRHILKMQARRTRCVTLMTSSDEIDQLVLSSRDPLSFVLHDLDHADHFFSGEMSLKGQLGFYALMEKIYDRPLLKKRLREDLTFKTEFEYVVSDMNAYAIHLFKCLKACVVKSQTVRGDQAHHDIFLEILKWWEMPFLVSKAAEKLNTPDFSDEDELHLKNFFENSNSLLCPY